MWAEVHASLNCITHKSLLQQHNHEQSPANHWRSSVFSNWRVAFTYSWKNRTVCLLLLSPTGLTDNRTMSEPTKQDISAVFKRLRTIPTNKVSFVLTTGAFGVFVQEVCQSKSSDTSHPVGNPGLAFYLNVTKSLFRVSLKVVQLRSI